ncbi:conserved hypothetical protein [Ricinus communis]|uniref:Disease resistance R13L4/SHOC-2-like LRR domain-containing protein n=1 Tax=Ricinus communis TaxID=3988 RepID=B9SGE3_RICCO|nr:conserved hypothetical protein [Ricinus communis]
MSAEDADDSYQGLSSACMQSVCQLQFLLVLDIEGGIESMPDEVGLNLVQLTYSGLIGSNLDKLPRTLEVLKIQQLKHLLMCDSINNGGVRVPKEIGILVNLQTRKGVYARDGIVNELATLTQFRKLNVTRVSEDHASDLASAIMKMENLISLSLETEMAYFGSTRSQSEFEPFSPPHLLQEIKLVGALVDMPSRLASMDNLTKLYLTYSDLSENQFQSFNIFPN